jgi:hypothetical protein
MASPPFYRSPVMSAFAAVLLFVLGGCGSPPPREAPPPLFPVAGQVVLSDGKSFPGGVIHFVSRDFPTFSITGEIASDGSFSVGTTVEGELLPGAPPGPCQVSVNTPLTKDLTDLQTFQATQEYVIERGPNQFQIEVRKGTK